MTIRVVVYVLRLPLLGRRLVAQKVIASLELIHLHQEGLTFLFSHKYFIVRFWIAFAFVRSVVLLLLAFLSRRDLVTFGLQFLGVICDLVSAFFLRLGGS